MKTLPSFETCHKLFQYNPETGIFLWKERLEMGRRWNTHRANRPAFTSSDKDGYKVSRFINPDTGKKERFLAARIAYLMMTGSQPHEVIDHINGVRHDNRWSNLRPASDHQNKMNVRRQSTGTSRFQGVFFQKSVAKWRAQIRMDGKAKCLGLFSTEESAARARDDAARAAYGDFAVINFPSQT